MSDAETERQYLTRLRESIRAPQGFRVAVGEIAFAVAERGGTRQTMNLALVHSGNRATSYAALTTTNRLASPSAAYLRQRGGGGHMQTVLVNNKISNVGSKTGAANFSNIRQRLAELLNVDSRSALSVSTGVIGWTLPIEEIIDTLPSLVERLGQDGFVDFARAIMTTDRFVKARVTAVGGGTLLGVCKGAGMVEPNLNTMLVFLFTDLSFSNRQLNRMLRAAVAESFGRITVDGDQSTSDIVMIQSSNALPHGNERQCAERLTELCHQLAMDTVRNGEGVGHVVEMRIIRARTTADAAALARYMLNSRLVATAIAGNDPNVGRIIARVGQYFAPRRRRAVDMRKVRMYIESQLVFADGHFILTSERERAIAADLTAKGWDAAVVGYPIPRPAVHITVDLGNGNGNATAYGGDLTPEYVHINADYRS